MALKYALKLIFLKFIFEFLINTAPPASNSVYGREKLFWYDKIKFSNHVCHCSAVVKELLARADKLGSTPGDTVFCFPVHVLRFFSAWSLFFLHYFSFWPAFLYSYCWPCWSCTLINIYFTFKFVEFNFGRGISKALDLHTGQAYHHKETISCQDMSLLWNSWIFYNNVSWHHDKQHTIHHKLC